MKLPPIFITILCAWLAADAGGRADALTPLEQADAFHARGVAAEQRGEPFAAENCYTLALRAVAGHPATLASMAELEKKLPSILEEKAKSTILPRVTFSRVTPENAFRWISAATGIKIVYAKDKASTAQVTLNLRDVPTIEVLRRVVELAQLQLTFSYEKDGIHVSGKAVIASASHTFQNDTVAALNDGREPSSSADTSIPRFTWRPHQGTFEWVQFDFATPQVIEGCSVYWYQDNGGVKLPGFWKVLFLDDSGMWMPVDGQPPAPALDAWNTCRFKPVRSKGLRVAAQLGFKSSSGILEWKVIPSSVQMPPSPPRPGELRLDEIVPITAKAGAVSYRVNRYSKFEEDRGAQIIIDSKPCDHFLFAHANSSVTFAVPAGYSHFSAVGIGPTNQRGRKEYSWTYQVLADGKQVYQSKRLDTYPGNKVAIEVNLPPGIRTITLVTDGGDRSANDHSIWAHPKLVRSAGGNPPANVSAQPAPQDQSGTASQSWTTIDGRAIQAKFIKLDRESVVIEKDGQQFTVSFANLSPASVEQAKKLGNQPK